MRKFGFRKSHSTSHAIITLIDRVSQALDTGKYVVGLYLDITLRKAFDAVPHSILLKKLYALSVRGNLYNWFESYLKNKKQYVIYNNSESDIGSITHGVPQGSILGPLLFIIYMNDFSKASELLFVILFADDTNIFLEGMSYNKIILEMNTGFVSKLFIVLFTYLSTIFSSIIAMSHLSELVYMYLYVYLYGGVCICLYL